MTRSTEQLQKASRVQLLAAKKKVATALRAQMQGSKMSVRGFARQIGTSPAAVRRILDRNNTSISLATMFRALTAAGLSIEVTARPLSDKELLRLAQGMVDAPNPELADALQQDFVDGFYGKHVPRPQE
jgi:hypothetical protein